MKEHAKSFAAFATVAGTIFGVGVFAIPATVARAGFPAGLFWFFILGIAITLVHLWYGSLQLSGDGHRRLIGLATEYFGAPGRIAALISTLVGTSGALLAYFIVAGSFARMLGGDAFSLSADSWSFIFLAAMSFLVLGGLRSVARFETLVATALFAGSLIFIGVLLSRVNAFTLPSGEAAYFFMPYGVILFALYGANAIPEALAMLGRNARRARAAIVGGTLLPLAVYIGFTVAVLLVSAASGAPVSRDAISGLAVAGGDGIIRFAAAIGILAVATSFVVVASYLADALHYDLHMPRMPARVIVLLIPPLVFLAGARNFVAVIGIVGSILGAVEGVLISGMFSRLQRSKAGILLVRTPFIAPLFLGIIFVVGMLGEFIALVRGIH